MIFRSQTDAMLAAKFDPEPWVMLDRIRALTKYRSAHHDPDARFDPRPEFIPSRYTRPINGQCWEAKRPAPNPILVAFRNEDGDYSAEEWLSFIEDWRGTPEQVEHARKVLTRLAALS